MPHPPWQPPALSPSLTNSSRSKAHCSISGLRLTHLPQRFDVGALLATSRGHIQPDALSCLSLPLATTWIALGPSWANFNHSKLSRSIKGSRSACLPRRLDDGALSTTAEGQTWPTGRFAVVPPTRIARLPAPPGLILTGPRASSSSTGPI